jgi:hypothetical protein
MEKKKYPLKSLQRVLNYDAFLQALAQKETFQAVFHGSVDGATRGFYQAKLTRLRSLLETTTTWMKDNSQSWPWHPKNLGWPRGMLNPEALKTKEEDFEVEIGSLNTLGVYLIEYPNNRGHKVGMSFNCFDRVNRQGCEFGVKMFNKEELDAIVPDELVEQILELDLPGLYFHADHWDHCKYLIKMQLVEMLSDFLARHLNQTFQDCHGLAILNRTC